MKAVLIEWRDTSGGCLTGWEPIEEMVEEVAVCRTYGEIIKETVDLLLVVPHLCVNEGKVYGDSKITIHKCDIIRTVELIEKAQEA